MFAALIAFIFGSATGMAFMYNPDNGVIKGKDESFVFCGKAYCETDGKTLRDGFYVSVPKNSETPQTAIAFYKAGKRIGEMTNYLDSGAVAAIIPYKNQDSYSAYSIIVGTGEDGGLKSVYVSDCTIRDNNGECKKSVVKP